MNIYPDTLELATWTVTADVDLSSATAEVYLAGSWQALAWAGAAVHTGSTWTRDATITVAGANPGSGVKPDATTDKAPLVRVTSGGEVIIRRSTAGFDVRT